MSYHISTSEGFAKELKRILDEQAVNTIRFLTEVEDIHEGVHNARRYLKVIRAAIRLVKEDLEETSYSCKNRFYRDQARKLSQLRDATAMLETLQLLEIHYGEKLDAPTMDILKSYYLDRREKLNSDNEAKNTLIQEVAVNLQNTYATINQFELSSDYQNNVIKSIYRVYRKGYNAFKKNYLLPHAENSHDWRKRAKYLRYQVHILQDAWPAIFSALEKELHVLTDFLGDYQNLSVFSQHLSQSDSLLNDSQKKELQTLCSQHQEHLHQQALPVAQKLYAEQPAVFAKRIGQYLKSWEGF